MSVGWSDIRPSPWFVRSDATQFAFGFRRDEPGRGGSEAVSSAWLAGSLPGPPEWRGPGSGRGTAVVSVFRPWGTTLPAAVAHFGRRVGLRHLAQPLEDFGSSTLGQGRDGVGADQVVVVVRELEEPDDGIDVGPVAEPGDDRCPVFGLGIEDQAAQLDLFAGQPARRQEQLRRLGDAGLGVMEPLQDRILGQEHGTLGERDHAC